MQYFYICSHFKDFYLGNTISASIFALRTPTKVKEFHFIFSL